MHEPVRIAGSDIAEQMLGAVGRSRTSTTTHLAGFVAASDPAGMSFQKAKQKAALKAGITYRIAAFPDSLSQEAASAELAALIADEEVGGIVIQLPLPAHLDTQALLDQVPPEKDPDLLSAASYTAFLNGTSPVVPPAARAVEILTESLNVPLGDKTVAIVGMGRLVGQPVAAWLRTRAFRVMELDLGFDESVLAEADLVILGTGSYTLDPALLREGAGVIDFGYRRVEGSLSGDLDTSNQEAVAKLAFYTPTPGGTGPILIAALIENFARLNQ